MCPVAKPHEGSESTHEQAESKLQAIESEHEQAESLCDEISASDSKDSVNSEKSTSRNWQGHWPKTPGRLIGTGLIRLYQLTLSGFIGNSCRHQPTCSEYGYEAIARHGILRGGWLTLKRVAKCHPFGTSGYDPVPKDKK